ncbi:MAG: hydantoinase/oxoprolinase family protein [Pseudomonadota bacterium]
MLRVAIDIGGTFTDVVAETEGGLRSVKVLTSAQQPEVAALDGIERVLGVLSKTHADISDVVHGTTLATNALIERRGAKTALVTTAGFRDVLAMRNEKRFEQYALDIQLPEPLVPRPLRLPLRERILADGSVSTAPSDAEIDAIATVLDAERVEAVAIGFLHSYKNPSHETYVAKRLQQLLGRDVTVCCSADVAREIREYERFSTVCANAYVRPLMARYLQRLRSALKDRGFDGAFLMVLSDGALTTVDQAMRYPIRLVEGGPAGGVALAAHVAREVGSDKTLSLDIGGTTAKICFIENGTPQTNRRFEVARAWRDVKGSGLPVKIPTVELVEIGAGGGSIAAVDGLGRLKIGPKSAGSEPGPAAYNRGGVAATITDAHLTVGNIAPEGFAGGMIALWPLRAPDAVRSHVQLPLGMDAVEPAAAGVVELADETMANAARVHGIELGLDIAGFDLLVSGGGGGLHGARIADKLGIRRIIVPQNAGVGSAVGFLRSPVAFESAISVVEVLSAIDPAALTARVRTALKEVETIVARAAPGATIQSTVKAEMRYQGQGLEIALPLDMGGTEDGLGALQERFEGAYRRRIGFTLSDIAVELVSISVSARETRTPCGPKPQRRRDDDTPLGTRAVYDLAAATTLDYRVADRAAMTGRALCGPAVVTEEQTTTLVRPGWSVRRSDQGHLILERAPT